MNIDKIYTTQKVAEIIGSHPKTIARLCKSGELKASKKLGKWIVLHSDLLVYLVNQGTPSERLDNLTLIIDKVEADVKAGKYSAADIEEMKESTRELLVRIEKVLEID